MISVYLLLDCYKCALLGDKNATVTLLKLLKYEGESLEIEG